MLAPSRPTSALIPDEFQDRLNALYEQEAGAYRTGDYLQLHREFRSTFASTVSNIPSEEAVEEWRHVLGEWAYRLTDRFGYPRETVAVCMNYVDRYLFTLVQAQHSELSKEKLQLVFATCLYVAMKVSCPTFLAAKTIAFFCRDCFSKEQILAAELDLLEKLEWRLRPPTAHILFQHYSLLLEGSDGTEFALSKAQEEGRFVLEVAVLDYYFVSQRPSHVAMAALLNVLEDTAAEEGPSTIANNEMDYLNKILMKIAAADTEADADSIRKCQERLRCVQNQTVEDTEVTIGRLQDPLSHAGLSSPTSVAHRS